MYNPKFCFWHLPKNGGTAIFSMTQKWKNHRRAHPEKNHIRIVEYPPKPDETVYTVIRHPYSRFTSAFYHLVDACHEDFFYKKAKVSDCDWLQRYNISMNIFNNDPNEFLKALQEKIHPYHLEAQKIFYHFDILKPQFYWISNGGIIDPRIKLFLNQENLEKEFKKFIADPLGQYAQWPRDRKSNSRISKNTIPLNEQSKAILRALYRDDFKHLNFHQ